MIVNGVVHKPPKGIMKNDNLPPPIDVLVVVKAAIKEIRWYEWVLLVILIVSAMAFWFRAINQHDRVLMEQFGNFTSAPMYVGALFYKKMDRSMKVTGPELKYFQPTQ